MLLEFSMMRAVSQQLAASTTTRALTVTSRARLLVDVRNARGACRRGPRSPRGTMAPVRSSRLPVFSAGAMWTPGEAKFALTAQARPHSAQ